MKPTRALLLVLALLVVYGCAPSNMVSQKDPRLGDARYGSLLVLARIGDIADRMTVEDLFVFRLQRMNMDVTASAKLFLPNKKYSRKTIASMLRRDRIQGVLIIEPSAGGADEGPPPFKRYRLGLDPRRWGMLQGASAFDVSIYDVGKGRTVWTAHAGGAGGQGGFALVNYLVDATELKLQQDGMLPR